MEVKQKMLLELASQFGFDDSDDPRLTEAANLADEYKNKSEQEILKDIMRLKRKYSEDPSQMKKQIQTVKTLRSMMNREQQERLDQVLAMLEKE